MQNLLDLCRLNQIDENIQDSPAIDRDATLKAIDMKRRQLIMSIAADTVPATEEVMQAHRLANYDDCSDS